jgi:hypothetical protein
MFKTFLSFILVFSSAAIAGATPLPNFTPTPLPPQISAQINHNLNAITNCASNDCNDYHSSVHDKLPDPVPAEAEPAAGDKQNFCRDVNVQDVPEICNQPSLVGNSIEASPAAGTIVKPKHKRRHKHVIMGS